MPSARRLMSPRSVCVHSVRNAITGSIRVAEQRDVGADPEREAENGDEGEPWRLEQLPGGVAEHGHQQSGQAGSPRQAPQLQTTYLIPFRGSALIHIHQFLGGPTWMSNTSARRAGTAKG